MEAKGPGLQLRRENESYSRLATRNSQLATRHSPLAPPSPVITIATLSTASHDVALKSWKCWTPGGEAGWKNWPAGARLGYIEWVAKRALAYSLRTNTLPTAPFSTAS